MSYTVKHFHGLAEPEEGQETTTATRAVARAVQCTDTTDNMNYEDFIYTSCEVEKSFIKHKSELVV